MDCTDRLAPAAKGIIGAREFAIALPEILRLWLRRVRTRRQLRRLDVRQLADVGLDEGQRRDEGVKWFWEA